MEDIETDSDDGFFFGSAEARKEFELMKRNNKLKQLQAKQKKTSDVEKLEGEEVGGASVSTRKKIKPTNNNVEEEEEVRKSTRVVVGNKTTTSPYGGLRKSHAPSPLVPRLSPLAVGGTTTTTSSNNRLPPNSKSSLVRAKRAVEASSNSPPFQDYVVLVLQGEEEGDKWKSNLNETIPKYFPGVLVFDSRKPMSAKELHGKKVLVLVGTFRSMKDVEAKMEKMKFPIDDAREPLVFLTKNWCAEVLRRRQEEFKATFTTKKGKYADLSVKFNPDFTVEPNWILNFRKRDAQLLNEIRVEEQSDKQLTIFTSKQRELLEKADRLGNLTKVPIMRVAPDARDRIDEYQQQTVKEKKTHFERNQRMADAFFEIGELLKDHDSNWHTNRHKHRVYSNASWIIRKLDFLLTSSSQMQGVEGFGNSMLSKIDEFVDKGKLEKLESLKNDPRTVGVKNLCEIWGVGRGMARDLYSWGFHSVDALQAELNRLGCFENVSQAIRERRTALQSLQRVQYLGVKYFHDISNPQKRMHRGECESILFLVKHFAIEIYAPTDPSDLCVEICGSYRRGRDGSKDVDIIITKKGMKNQCLPLQPLLSKLREVNLISETLSSSEVLEKHRAFKEEEAMAGESEQEGGEAFLEQDELHSDTFFGIVKLPRINPVTNVEDPCFSNIHRRVDIKSYPPSCFAFATLSFTGPAELNRSMRWEARRQGKSLSDKELVIVSRLNKGKVKFERIACETERDVFHALGLKYLAPKEREGFTKCYRMREMFGIEQEEKIVMMTD